MNEEKNRGKSKYLKRPITQQINFSLCAAVATAKNIFTKNYQGCGNQTKVYTNITFFPL